MAWEHLKTIHASTKWSISFNIARLSEYMVMTATCSLEKILYWKMTSQILCKALLSLLRKKTKDKLQRILQINGGFTFKFSKRFSFRNSMGVRYNNIRQDIFYGKNSINGKRSSINGSIQYNESGNFQTSNVLTYDYKTKNKNSLSW